MNPEAAFVSDTLLEQAEQRGHTRLASDPDNPTVLESLAEVYRKQGKLREAAALYERLAVLKPEDPHLAYTHAVLSGQPWSDRPANIQASAFVLLDNFLPQSLHEKLMPFMLAAHERLTPAMVGDAQYNPQSRESLELREAVDIQRPFARHIREALPAILSQLHVEPFDIGRLEVSLRVYLDGHFFRVHMDNPANTPNANRQVSYVYFYHRVPRSFGGGDLLLYDTDMAENRYTTAKFTRVQPVDNSIVFFPSSCYHGVVPVRCPSKQLADSRFAVNGHVSKRVEVVSQEVTDSVETAGAVL
jgi:hypothetical protein